MKRNLFSLAALMGVVATAAVDFSIVRRSVGDTAGSGTGFLFATGAMPLASLLILVGLIATPRLVRTGGVSSFVIGFEALGWAAVFAFIACYSISIKMVMDGAEVIVAMCRPALSAHLQDLPDLPGWAGMAIELGFATVLFSLPQLLFALLGGWFACRCGLRPTV